MSQRRRGGGTRGSAYIFVALLIAVNYFIFFRESPDEVQRRNEELASLTGAMSPEDDAQSGYGMGALDDFGEPVGRELTGEIKRGQTVLHALRALGVDSQAAQPIIQAMSGGETPLFDFTRSRVGDSFSVKVDDDGQVVYFSYTQSPIDIYEVLRTEEGEYIARKKKVPTRLEVAHVGCALRSSLYESVRRCGEGPEVAAKLIDLFAWDVDFFEDIREGDEFKFLVEKISLAENDSSRFLRYGRILAAEYHGKFGSYQILGFEKNGGDFAYYTPDGRAVRKEFIKSPLKYTRVSAGTKANIRRNLKTAAPVIYEAPAKTPVWAVAGGTVISAGDTGGNLGTRITIRHDDGYTSTYAHLGSIASGIKVGTVVRQKTLLGQVGKSGNTDSPKLLFSLRKDGQLQDPLRLNFAEAEPIAEEERERFETELDQVLEDLRVMPVIGIHESRS